MKWGLKLLIHPDAEAGHLTPPTHKNIEKELVISNGLIFSSLA